jgi:DNA-binding FadR family transcriptional regulator
MLIATDVNGGSRVSRRRSFREERLSSQVARQIEEMISAEFPPGSRLPREQDLAERFHVSRIVIREAMKVQEDRGVVEVQAGRGTTVITPTSERVSSSLLRLLRGGGTPKMEEMEQLLEIREALEESAAALACARASADDLSRIEAALRGMRTAKGSLEVFAADLCFHVAITQAAGNRFFEMVLEPLAEVFLKQIQLTDRVNIGIKQHARIFNAIRRRDPVEARVAVRSLLNSTRQDVRRALLAPRKNQSPRKLRGGR